MPANSDGVNIVITGDASQVIKEIEATSKSLDGIKSSQVKVIADASQAAGEVAKVAGAVDSINDGHIDITADSSQAVDAVEKVADTADSISDAHVDITADSSQAVDEAVKASDAVNNIGDAHSEITADGKQALKETKKVQDNLKSIDGKTVEVKVEAKVDAQGRLHKANGQFITMGEKLGANFSSGFMKKAAEWSVNFDNWGKSLETTFGTAFKTITAGAIAVAGAIGKIAKSALAIGGGFEAQMTTVKVISGATGEELEALTKKAREMGATLPITAKDAAMAMTVMAQRGTSVKDILTSVTDVSNLAISQSVSLAEAAALLGSTMTNFGIAVEDASKVTAIFNNASNQSALNMSKLTEALKYVGPTAGSIGMELTEAISAMEALANAGLTGEMTGTGLAMVLTKLSTKSRIMGVDTRDLQGNLRPLADIFSELQAKGFALAEATSEFGARGRLAALNLAKQSDALKTNEERLKDYGTTQGAVDEKAKTFTNTIAALTSAIEEIHIEVFEQIKNQSKGAVSGITELVRSLSDWVSNTKAAEKALNAFLEGLGFNIPSGEDFKRLLDQLDVQAVVNRVKSFGAAIKSIAESIASFVDKIKTPLLFLIEHLDTFATISFWSWIVGKGMQVPLVLMNIASSFIKLASAFEKFGKALLAINISKLVSLSSMLADSSLLAFLTNPTTVAVGFSALTLFEVVRNTNKAYSELEKAQKEEKRYLQEQALADSTLDLDIEFNVKTGFEKLPESWTKASDELREKANDTVKELRATFEQNVLTAMDNVAARIPEIGGVIMDLKESLSSLTLNQLTQSLQGSKEAFDALPAHMQKVVVELYDMGVRAGQVTGNIEELIYNFKYLSQLTPNTKSIKESEFAVFSKELSASVNSLVEQLPANIKKMKQFLGDQNLEIAVKFSLKDAQENIKKLSKSLAEKFNVPKDFISSAIFTQLKSLADNGNKTAQSLYNSWKNSTEAIDNFLLKAQDAVTYLGASPDKFTPALNSLMKGIQKIDPITGKVTEQFKKAYDALKQWGNVTFSQLEQRIQRLRKAVESGLVDKSVLEKEFRRVSQQVKLKITTELEPTRSSYQSQSAFNSVVASEYFSRMGELGGAAFMNLVQKEFENLYDKSGSSIGSAIMRQVDKLSSADSKSVLKINGVDMSQKSQQTQAIDFTTITKSISDSVQPFINKLEQFNPQQYAPNYDVVNKDYSSQLAGIIHEIQNVSAGINTLNNLAQGYLNSNKEATQAPISVSGLGNSSGEVFSSSLSPLLNSVQTLSETVRTIQGINQANSSAILEISNAVRAVEVAVKSINSGDNYDIDITQQGFVIQKKSDADSVAQSMVNALRSGFGNGGV